jgi:hypothetical protein
VAVALLSAEPVLHSLCTASSWVLSQRSVSPSYLDRFVPRQLLHRTDIDPGHDEAASECMPEIMPVEVGYTPV